MLYEKLEKYAKSDVYPMHMPGHKRNAELLPGGFPLSFDITEISDFDDLKDPQGDLLETAKLAAEIYHSKQAFLLVNGSTVGILAGIGAHTKCGDTILATHGCHWSISNAAELFGLNITYATPKTDPDTGVPCSISPRVVEQALEENRSIKLVVITSPSYEGVVSDIETIADITHKQGALLLVDSAHGAHLGFSEKFPKNPITQGADIVVMSLHKTLPALTQCSLLHICSDRADMAQTKKMLYILQTSSPSYVLMASIDYCLRLLKSDSKRLFDEYEKNLSDFYASVRNLRNLTILRGNSPEFFDLDLGKIVIVTKNAALCGKELMSTFREKYSIELEKATEEYTIAMTSICDSKEGLTRLAAALCEIDASQ
ncbi:MAG: aminotransferase class V-fold PLP-dependent enzyme [Oscillospiraceae bacterium]|nr:aminotransferase class V-fold PLP-dependent enzyme [Oscillospiraceae bacterium]MCL2278851.1 aminotransferase class V-fold PLP-dependent enzyme [Oscillospiraceae bacterium]